MKRQHLALHRRERRGIHCEILLSVHERLHSCEKNVRSRVMTHVYNHLTWLSRRKCSEMWWKIFIWFSYSLCPFSLSLSLQSFAFMEVQWMESSMEIDCVCMSFVERFITSACGWHKFPQFMKQNALLKSMSNEWERKLWAICENNRRQYCHIEKK